MVERKRDELFWVSVATAASVCGAVDFDSVFLSDASPRKEGMNKATSRKTLQYDGYYFFSVV